MQVKGDLPHFVQRVKPFRHQRKHIRVGVQQKGGFPVEKFPQPELRAEIPQPGFHRKRALPSEFIHPAKNRIVMRRARIADRLERLHVGKGQAQAQEGHLGVKNIQIGGRQLESIRGAFRLDVESLGGCGRLRSAEPRNKRRAGNGIAGADRRFVGMIEHGFDVFVQIHGRQRYLFPDCLESR